MDVTDLLQQIREAVTVRQVFGDAYERDGATVIPVATVRGGGGGGHGEGSGPEAVGKGSGSGGGFGVAARPAGVFVIEGNSVRWQPAVDINRIILGGQIVVVVALLVLRSALRHRS